MTKRGERPQSSRHVNILDEDWDYLTSLYGPQSASKIGVSRFIRDSVHALCQRLRAKEAEALDLMKRGGS